MKKILRLITVFMLLRCGVAFGAVLFEDSFEYANQAAFEAEWDVFLGTMPTLTTDVSTHGSKSLFSPGDDKGLAVKTIFGTNTTDIEVSIKWYYNPAAGYDSYRSGFWMSNVGGSGEVGFRNDGPAAHALQVQQWPSDGTNWHNTGFDFVVGWNTLVASIASNGDVNVTFNGETAGSTYNGGWGGLSIVYMGHWWDEVAGRDVAFDELRIITLGATAMLTVDASVSDPCGVGSPLIDPCDINSVTPGIGDFEYAEYQTAYLNAEPYTDACPDLYVFDHWSDNAPDANGVADPYAASTTILMDKSKAITVHYILSMPQCGDLCHPIVFGDFDEDCDVDMTDYAMIASHWLSSTKP